MIHQAKAIRKQRRKNRSFESQCRNCERMMHDTHRRDWPTVDRMPNSVADYGYVARPTGYRPSRAKVRARPRKLGRTGWLAQESRSKVGRRPPRTKTTSPRLWARPLAGRLLRPTAGMAKRADLRVVPRKFAGYLTGGVRRTIVDDQEFETLAQVRGHLQDLGDRGRQSRLGIADGQENSQRTIQGHTFPLRTYPETRSAAF